MGLLDVEKFVLYKGILGCPLRELPDNLVHEIDKADALEIVEAEDSLGIPHSLINASAPNTYNINEIDSKGDFVIRPKHEAWRKIVFNGKNIHSGNMAAFCTLAIQHPEGLTKRFVKSRIPSSEKNLSKWIRRLEKANVLHMEMASDDAEIIKFNYDLIERQGEPGVVAAMPASRSTLKRSSETLATDETVERAMEAIKDYPNGMPTRRLRALLNASDGVLKAVIGRFRTMEDFQVVENNGKPLKIMFTGTIKTKYIDAEIVEFLLDMCRSLRVIVLSEQPKELKKMKVAMGIGDERLTEILEDNDFKIIEIRSKYLNSDFVVFSPQVDDTDEELIAAITRAKSKMARYFRTKIKNTFFKNIYFTSFDNNYSPHLKERVMCFYRYIAEQMKNNAMFFFFSNETLLEMNFFSFIRSVPLRTDLHFIEIMTQVGKRSGRFSEETTKRQLESLGPGEYDKINTECLGMAKKYTLGQVLDMLEDSAESKINLLARVNVH